jgi:hypothetical protein
VIDRPPRKRPSVCRELANAFAGALAYITMRVLVLIVVMVMSLVLKLAASQGYDPSTFDPKDFLK